MKFQNLLLIALISGLCVTGTGCGSSARSEIKAAIQKELDPLRDADGEAVKSLLASDEALENGSDELIAVIQETVQLFFKDFDYSLTDIRVNQKDHTASAVLKTENPDASALARDYAAACIREEMMKQASSSDSVPEEDLLDLPERFQILQQLLREHTYDKVEKECPVTLIYKDDAWVLVRTASLEDCLTGGLLSGFSDASVLSPSETLSVFFDTLKEMDETELINYLRLSPADQSDRNAAELVSALVSQVKKHFAYEILEEDVQGYLANVQASITTYDGSSILNNFERGSDTYLDSSEAVIDGEEGRQKKTHDLLISCIRENINTTSSDIVFHMRNDGTSWKLSNENQEIGEALFGSLPPSVEGSDDEAPGSITTGAAEEAA